MKHVRGLALCIVASAALWGCRASPFSLATMIVGDVANSVVLEGQRKELFGKTAGEADVAFGERVETLEDRANTRRVLIFYRVQADLLDNARIVVELVDGKIVALTKAVRNIDGVEDMVRASGLKDKIIGLSAAECQRKGELGKPIAVLRCKETGRLVRVYDVRNVTNLRGARYCVLRFDDADLCNEVHFTGVSASTKKDPLRG